MSEGSEAVAEPALRVPPAPGLMRVLAAWLLAALYTGLIWFLSSQTLDFKLMDEVPMRDKGVHFVEYGVLGGFLAYACHATWPRQRLRFLVALWLTCALGLVDELHQLYVPGRSADAVDLVADALGGTLVVGVFAGVRGWLAQK